MDIMEIRAIVILCCTVVWGLQMVSSYENETLWRSQRKVDMTFLRNWAVSIGLPIFAVVDCLVIWPIIKAGHPWWLYLLCLIIGYDTITRRLFQHWQKNIRKNLGHIINSHGRITSSGWVHYIYMGPQAMLVLLFLFTPIPDKTLIFSVSALFITFLVIQGAQSEIIQKSFSWEIIPEIAGVILLVWFKI